MKKTLLSLILCLALMGLAVSGAFAETDAETYRLRLGTSPYAIDVGVGTWYGDLTEEEIEEGQVGYYYSEDSLLDFDVYQFSKDGLPNELAAFAASETQGLENADESFELGEINGIPAAWYTTVEEYEGEEYDTLTYILDADEDFVEIVFWLDGEGTDAEAAAIIGSLVTVEPNTIRLGTTAYSITLPVGYMEGGISDEDIADDQIAYWYSIDSLLDIDIYQFDKDGMELQEYAEYEAEDYGDYAEEVVVGEVNGITAAWYYALEEYEEDSYNTVTYILDAGDDFMEIVFWLDGENAEAETAEILNTLTMDAE